MADLMNAVTTLVDVHRPSLIASTICPATMMLEQARRIAEMRRTAGRRDSLFLSGKLSAGESGSLFDRLFPLDTLSVYDGFIGHSDDDQEDRGRRDLELAAMRGARAVTRCKAPKTTASRRLHNGAGLRSIRAGGNRENMGPNPFRRPN